MPRTNRILFIYMRWIWYMLRAKHKKGFGVHSPFTYKLIKNVFRDKKKYSAYDQVESAFKTLKKTSQRGSASDHINFITTHNDKASVKKIIDQLSLNIKYGRLLFRIASFYKIAKIVEIGTDQGISTAYLANSTHCTDLQMIEGNEVYFLMAKQIVNNFQLNNVTLHDGLFRDKLPLVLEETKSPGLVFFDCIRNQKVTLDLFNFCKKYAKNETIFIFNGIHYSKESEIVWTTIMQCPDVKLSVDIFRMGLVFFRKELSKQHFIVRF